MIRAFIDSIRYMYSFGRTGRKGYWFAVLSHLIVIIILGTILAYLEDAKIFKISSLKEEESVGAILFMLCIYALYIAEHVLFYTLSARRLHDIGCSAWLYCVNIVPLIGPLVLLILHCFASKEDNIHGSKPIDGYTTAPFPPRYPPSFKGYLPQ